MSKPAYKVGKFSKCCLCECWYKNIPARNFVLFFLNFFANVILKYIRFYGWRWAHFLSLIFILFYCMLSFCNTQLISNWLIGVARLLLLPKMKCPVLWPAARSTVPWRFWRVPVLLVVYIWLYKLLYLLKLWLNWELR